jgi:hypothetical protein
MPFTVDHKCWKIHPLHYSMRYHSAASIALIHRLSQLDSPDLESYLGLSHTTSKQQPCSDQNTDTTVDIAPVETQYNPQLASSFDNHDKEEHNKEENDKEEHDKETEEDPFKVISSVTMKFSQLDEDYQNKKLYDSDSDNVHVSDNNNTQNRQNPNDITASFIETEYGDNPEEEDGITVYRDP